MGDVNEEMKKAAVEAFWAQDCYEHTQEETERAMADALEAALAHDPVREAAREAVLVLRHAVFSEATYEALAEALERALEGER